MRNTRDKKNKRYYGMKYGDHLYYSAFSPNNSGKVRALVNTSFDALAPYHAFLSEALKQSKSAANYSVDWEEVKQEGITIRLQPTQLKICIDKPEPFLLIDISKVTMKKEKNRLIYQDSDEMVTFQKADVEISGDDLSYAPKLMPAENEAIELNGITVDYIIENLDFNKETKLKDQAGMLLDVLSVDAIDGGWNVILKTSQRPKELLCDDQKLKFDIYESRSFSQLFDEQEKEVVFSNKNGFEVQLKQEPDSKGLQSEDGISYTWHKRKSSNNQDFHIQLIDNDALDTERPASDYFFDDGVSAIYQGKDSRKSLLVLRKKSEEKILILKRDFRSDVQLIKGEHIKIAVNTVVLKRQRDAIQLLNSSPVESQKQLIQLFEKKTPHLWNKPKQQCIEAWNILKDESYDGTRAQRGFVKKAIETPDFAILEGPPGSGKTTAIIELILQLIKKGKKVLLAASTHVAIDNVLEKIKSYDEDNIVEPLRIGDSNRISEDVQQYQIDHKIEVYQKAGFDEALAKKMVLDGANLVCGTTMGIQQHPSIKDRDHVLPVHPLYDYLIIDESSKTTFQEFLVPALHAKKWVLVGDIKQLSPFVEQSHIVHNFNALVPQDEQRALQLAFETLDNNKNPYVIEVKASVIQKIETYLQDWNIKANNPYAQKVVSCVSPKQGKYCELIKDAIQTQEYLLGSDLILLESGCWSKYKDIIPKTHIIILEKEQEADPFFFQQFYLHKKSLLPQYNEINRCTSRFKNPLELKEHFKQMLKEQTWAEAIAWRMIRVYERRMLKKRDSYYEKTFKLLKPTAKDNAVDRIYNMTLPSILESLQKGNGEAHRNSTVITEGFDSDTLQSRHEMLNYQHRMHPSISKFSRDEFYTHGKNIALRDGKYTQREWSYDRYHERAVWLDVSKKRSQSDRTHPAEVKAIIKELKAFVDFAQRTPKENCKPWSIAVLTFYRPQETLLRKALREYCNQPNKMSRFEKSGVEIMNYTVDRFQGMEADLVFLSMVRGQSIGFLDNINRLNVALTRARFQRVIVGDADFFKKQHNSKELQRLSSQSEIIL